MSKRIGAVVTAAVLDADPDSAAYLKAELRRHQVSLAGLPTATAANLEKENPIVVPKADPKNPNQIGNLAYEVAARRILAATGDAVRGKVLFKSQSCVACHTDADGQTPKGPHLVEIGKRYKADELVESILKPGAKIAQGYETYRFAMPHGRAVTGFVVSQGAAAVRVREANGVHRELMRDDIDSPSSQVATALPDGAVHTLSPEQPVDLIRSLQSLK